jgi:hypothetical protein
MYWKISQPMSYYSSYAEEHRNQEEYERLKKQFLARKQAETEAAVGRKREEERRAEMLALHDRLNEQGFVQQYNK